MVVADWYFDELAHAGTEHLDPVRVMAYDRKASTDPEPDVAVLRALGMDTSSVLVDMGAGTGTFAIAAARHCHHVVAVDVSQAMLATIRDKAARFGLTNVVTVHAGLLSYEHQGSLADVVYSRHALHHIPDFWKALALLRVAAMLRPGGVLFLRDLVYCVEASQAANAIEAWLAAAPATPEEGWTRAELVEHVRGEYITFSWLLEPMLEQAGFTITARQVNAGGTHAAYTCVKR